MKIVIACKKGNSSEVCTDLEIFRKEVLEQFEKQTKSLKMKFVRVLGFNMKDFMKSFQFQIDTIDENTIELGFGEKVNKKNNLLTDNMTSHVRHSLEGYLNDMKGHDVEVRVVQ
jgi:hypothetical protein